MAVVGFHIYISIIMCLTAKARSDITTINAISELNNMIKNLNNNVAAINGRIDNLEKLIDTNHADSTNKDNVMTETGDVEQTNERVISEKAFVRNSLSVYEEKYKDFHKKIIEQMYVMNSKIEASQDKLERIRAENLANLNSWTKSQENRLSICPIPFDIDRRLSVTYELSSSSHVDVREGDTIRNQDYAIFNCSNVIEQKYEPANRRFQCVRGQWMEADISPDWKLGNNGSFPECREAICDPPCENGGVCIRDGLCRCKHMATGERCQIAAKCDPPCKNGGICFRDSECKCAHMTTGTLCETYKCGLSKVDVVIILDASTSVTQKNFVKMQTFAKDIVQKAEVNSGSVRIGVLIYSTDVEVQFHLNEYADGPQTSTNTTTHQIKEAIDRIPYIYGSTNSADALKTMSTEMFSARNGDRPDADNIAFIITDGVSNINSRRTIPEAKSARGKNIKIYAIGIGLQDTREMEHMASKPISENMFNVQEFDELKGLVDTIFGGPDECVSQHIKMKMYGLNGSPASTTNSEQF